MRKRIICLSIVVTLFITGICGRIGYIIFSGSYTVSEGYNSYVQTIDTLSPYLYYSNFSKMTNNENVYVAVIRPNAQCLNELNRLFNYTECQNIIEELKQGYPIVKVIDSEKKNRVKNIEIYKATTTNNNCFQLIDAKSSGLMKYLDNSVGSRKITFSIDAKGRLLTGDDGTIVDDNYDTKEGLKLSIDKKIQQITYSACASMKNGCAIVMNVEDSSILACVTKPDSSYINKPFSQYSVGSVFKIVVAACAVENGVDLKYTCNGSITVGDTKYSCQSNHIHGYQTLKMALANSCNCYFVNLALTLGKDKIIDTANKLGFDDITTIYNDWQVTNAILPSNDELSSKGQLALLGFGQGKLMSTPLQICSTLCTIANGGMKNVSKLIVSTVDSKGNETKVKYESSQRALSKDTCDTVLKYLRYVVSNGTGINADTDSHQSAGKTATAQTGQFIDGKEQLNTWFAGVYPYDEPKYAIVIMTEQGESGAVDCCPIFSTIIESLENM
jgi:cell division protein FtsI/penicillin-binding protein 2